MRFTISRASSLYNYVNKPHDKAYLDKDKNGEEAWLIDIETLDELLLLDSCGVIVTPIENNYPEIMIYDGYIE